MNEKDLIRVSLGFSKGGDSYNAAKEAATAALTGLKGKSPTLSLVFYAGAKYNPEQIKQKKGEIYSGLAGLDEIEREVLILNYGLT